MAILNDITEFYFLMGLFSRKIFQKLQLPYGGRQTVLKCLNLVVGAVGVCREPEHTIMVDWLKSEAICAVIGCCGGGASPFPPPFSSVGPVIYLRGPKPMGRGPILGCGLQATGRWDRLASVHTHVRTHSHLR